MQLEHALGVVRYESKVAASSTHSQECWPNLTHCEHNREKLEFMERLSLLLYAVMAYFQVITYAHTHAHIHSNPNSRWLAARF